MKHFLALREPDSSRGRRARLVAVALVFLMVTSAIPLMPGAEAALNSINLIDPNGGETIIAGSIFPVRWTVSGTGGYIMIQLSVNAGRNWEGIKNVQNLPAHGYGSYDWYVPPNLNETSCRIKLVWTSGLIKPFDVYAQDESAANFTVEPGVAISFTETPSEMSYGRYGLFRFDLYDPHDMVGGLRFTWRVNDGSGYGGWAPLPGDYSYYDPSRGWIWWMPTYYESATAEIRVEAIATGSGLVLGTDVTPEFEILSGTITLLKPDGGVTLVGGTTYTIEWRTSNDPSQVIMGVWLRYSVNGGSSWVTITYSTLNDWEEDWVIPTGVNSNEVLVEAIAQWGEWYTLDNDTSWSYNRIVSSNKAPGINLIDPNPPVPGGVVIGSGETYNIRWEAIAVASIKTLTLYYSVDNGSRWVLIGTASAKTGPYPWTAPAVDTYSARIKIHMENTLGGTLDTVSNHAFWIFDTIAFNRPPVANAGPDMTATEGASIRLDGTGSYDPDGDALTYTWTQIEPSFITATLSNPAYVTPSFTVDLKHYPVNFVFELEVSDGNEHTGFLYNVDRITVRVEPRPPDILSFTPGVGWAGTKVTIEGTDLMGAEVLFGSTVVANVIQEPILPDNPDPDNRYTFTLSPGVPLGVHTISVRNLMGTDSHAATIEVFPVPQWCYDNGLGFSNPSKHLLSYPWNPWGTGRYRDAFGNQVYLCLWVCIGIPYWTPWDGWECLGYLIDEPFCPDPLAAIFYGAVFCWIARHGECFGMSTNALRFFHNDQYVSEFDPPSGATTPGDLKDENGAIRRHVDWRQGAQMSAEILNGYLHTLINSLVPSSPISGMGLWIDEVKGRIDSGELGIATMICDYGAHAVVPYAYTDDGHTVRFYVYDSNQEEFSDPDLAVGMAAVADGTQNHPPYIEIVREGTYWDWSFLWPGGPTWSSPVGLGYVPYNVINGDRTMPLSIEGIFNLLAGSASGAIENDEGDQVGVDEDGGIMWGIEGAAPLPMFGGLGYKPQSWYLPVDTGYTAHLTGSADGTYNWSLVNNDTSAFWIEEAEVQEGSQDTVSVEYADGNPYRGWMQYGTSDDEKEYTASMVNTFGIRNRVYRIRGADLTDDGEHGMGTNEDYSGIVFHNGGSEPVVFDVEFQGNVVSEEVWNGTEPPEAPRLPTASREDIVVPPGATVTIYPSSWLDLDNAIVIVEGETVPGAPEDVAVVAEGATAVLTWSAPADDGGLPVHTYVVFRAVSEGDMEFLAAVIDGTTLRDDDVERGVEYTYRVSAVNYIGEGLAAEDVTVLIPELTTPSAPRDLNVSHADGKVTVRWEPPDDDGGSAITDYKVFRGTTPGNLAEVATVTGTSYVDDDVKKGTTYYYHVVAVNGVGDGAESSEGSATVPKEDTGDGDGGDVPWWVLVLVVVVFLVIIAVMAMRGGGGGGRGGPETMAPMGKEPEPTKPPPAVMAEEAEPQP